MASRPAPGELERLQAFVNTRDVDEDTDELTTPDELATWLTAQGLLDDGARVRTADLGRAVELREALRVVLLAHHGEPPEPGAVAVIEATARRAELAVRFVAPDASVALEPLAGGVDGALGRLLAIVAAAQADGTWERLKVCPADDCLWAFYDSSRNRSSRWCSMGVCGNRTKVRRYRERASDAHAHAHD